MSKPAILTIKGLGFGYWEGQLNGITYRIEPTSQYAVKTRAAKYRAVVKRRQTVLKEQNGFEVKDTAVAWLRQQARLNEITEKLNG